MVAQIRNLEALSAFESGDVTRSMAAHLLSPVPGSHDEPTLAQGYAY